MASVETFPTLTADEVMPVWSLNALCGIFEPDLVPPDAEVELEAEALVEPQATAPRASNPAVPHAASRVFHDAERNDPPWFETSGGDSGAVTAAMTM